MNAAGTARFADGNEDADEAAKFSRGESSTVVYARNQSENGALLRRPVFI